MPMPFPPRPMALGPLAAAAACLAAGAAHGLEARVPVFRFYNAAGSSHFYTASSAERDHVVATNRAYRYEGVAFCAYPGTAAGQRPVHRFYNARSASHFYTVDADESAQVEQNAAFRYEGPAWHAQPDFSYGARPVFRFYNASMGTHFYTIDSAEAGSIGMHDRNFQAEGVGFYAWNAVADPQAPGGAVCATDARVAAAYVVTVGTELPATIAEEDLRIELVGVADSRCPANALCVTAGAVTVDLRVSQAGSPQQPLVLQAPGPQGQASSTGSYRAYQFTLENVQPYPGITLKPITPSEYRVRLRVERQAGPGG